MDQQEMIDEHNNLVEHNNNEVDSSVFTLKDNGIKACEWCNTALNTMLRVEHGVFCSKSCAATSLAVGTFAPTMMLKIEKDGITEFANGHEEVEQLSESDVEAEDYDKCPFCHSDNVLKDNIVWSTYEQSVTVHCEDCGQDYEAKITVEYGGADIDTSIKTYKEED